MSRSLATKASALGLIALFHVAIFSDVAMLLCMPMDGAQVTAMLPDGMGADAPDGARMGMHHAGMSGVSADPTPQDETPVPHHDHGSCNFCCPHGQPEGGSLPALALEASASARDVTPAEYVELDLSPIAHLNTLPNPPPVA